MQNEGYMDHEFKVQARIDQIVRQHGPVDEKFVLERLRVAISGQGAMPHSLADRGVIVLTREDGPRGMIVFRVRHQYNDEEREVDAALRRLMPSYGISWGLGVRDLRCITDLRDMTFFALLERA